MLKIRLARIGKKKQPTFRFIVSESARDTYGHSLEILGHYNPRSKVCEVKKDRILYWVSMGAQVSPTVHNIFIDQNVLQGEKIKVTRSKKISAEEAAATAKAEQAKIAEAKAAKEKAATATAEAPAETKAEAPAEPTKEAVPIEEKKVEEKVEEEKEESKP